MSKEITNIQAERERERERDFKERFSQLFHDSINDFVWSKRNHKHFSSKSLRERERNRNFQGEILLES
jgi:hypothetical protein